VIRVHEFDAVTQELHTERLLMRRRIPRDVMAILAIHRNPAAVAHNPSDALADMAQAEALLTRWLDHWQRFGDQPVLNLLYRLDPSAWGDGIATEASSAVVTWVKMVGSYAGSAGRCGTSSRFLGRLPTPFPVSNHE
jgi:[ribosomal protein S5]-alanine N-acetyltransferase